MKKTSINYDRKKEPRRNQMSGRRGKEFNTIEEKY